MELENGLQDIHNDQCIVINRTIDDVHNNVDDLNGNAYVDVTSSKPAQVDWKVQNQLLSLKGELIPQKVSSKSADIT